jgi:signal transduction histidine kinase
LAPQRVVMYAAVMLAALLIVTVIASGKQAGDGSTLLGAALGVGLVGMGVLIGRSAAIHAIRRKDEARLAVSKAKQNEQREALLTIINATNQAIFTVSSNGSIRVYNAALLNLLDTNQSLSGRRVDDALPLFGQDGEAVSLYGLMKENTRFERDDLSFKFPDGDTIRLHLSVNKIQSAFSSQRQRDGEGFVCIVRDVTKQKSLGEERDEFISVVSHELRTPVTIAEGTISNVQYFLENGADPTKLTPSLKEAHEQVLLLANMINDLGTLSRAERGVGDALEQIDVKELVESLYKKYSASATKKKLSFNLDVGPRLGTMTTSRLYLEELLQNLITNAIKYTPSGSVTLRAHRNGDTVEFAVSDTGIGISKADLKHVFEKFYRSEDYRTRETSGTGLGLYVAAKLMRKLGTKIAVTSRLNHGSTFGFVLSEVPQKQA